MEHHDLSYDINSVMIDLVEVGNQKQLIHSYSTSFQEDYNKCLQKLLYLQDKSPHFVLFFPLQI